MWRLLLVLALVSSSNSLGIRRDESDMLESDEIEFPFAAVDDSIAGIPGAGMVDQTHQIGAAHSTRFQEAQVGCDMQGEADNPNPGESEDGDSVTDDPVRIDDALDGDFHRFACYATSYVPEIEPKIAADHFNLYTAQFEGNDRLGNATSSQYDVTDCGCVCSGKNHGCGLPGSTSYYSNIPSSQACSQMICHSNMFSRCMWMSEVVSSGLWLTNSVSFNSTSLEPAGAPLDPTENPLNLLPSMSPSVSPFPTPSPSISPSPSTSPPPTFRNLVIQRALGIVNTIKDQACLTIRPTVIDSIRQDLQAVNLTRPAQVVCPPPQDWSNVGESMDQIRADNATVDNALAGYGSGSAIAGDPTRRASLGMNDQSLLQVAFPHETIESRAWATVARLFHDRTPVSVLCAWDTPSVSVLLNVSRTLTPCNGTQSHAADSGHVLLSSRVIQTATDFYGATIEVLKRVYLERAEEVRRAAEERRAEQARREEEEREASKENESSGQQNSEEEDGDMEPPFIPPEAPAPDLEDKNPDMGSMGSGSTDEDCEEAPAGLVANDLQTQDHDSGRLPGQRKSLVIPIPGSNVLPEFGRTKQEWPIRSEESVTTIPQPVPFYEAEEDTP